MLRLALVFGYLIGCAGGVWLGVHANLPVTWLQAGVIGVAPTMDLLTELARYGTYGFGMLLLSTSYLGLMLVPMVLAVKGFLAGSSITVCLRGGEMIDWLSALLQVGLPGLVLLPALFLLGERSMRSSARLMALRFRDQPMPPQERDLHSLAAAGILLLLSAAIKVYVIPILLNWI